MPLPFLHLILPISTLLFMLFNEASMFWSQSLQLSSLNNTKSWFKRQRSTMLLLWLNTTSVSIPFTAMRAQRQLVLGTLTTFTVTWASRSDSLILSVHGLARNLILGEGKQAIQGGAIGNRYWCYICFAQLLFELASHWFPLLVSGR